jgi:hypothetical protein
MTAAAAACAAATAISAIAAAAMIAEHEQLQGNSSTHVPGNRQQQLMWCLYAGIAVDRHEH